MSDAHHNDANHGHPPSLAHHFDTPEQQYESAVQGMWLFLATEILLFGGLFCAYAVYRALHPEIFYYAYHHEYLSVFWGSVNTAVLLCSSFTMAAGVWAAQKGHQRMLVWMLVLTLLGAFGFMGIKYIEYKHKWEHGLRWGTGYNPEAHGAYGGEDHGDDGAADGQVETQAATDDATTAPAAAPDPTTVDASDAAAGGAAPTYRPGGEAPGGLVAPDTAPRELTVAEEVHNVRTFFAIYFLMTGLHGLHVIAGAVVIAWLLVRAIQGHFGAAYYTPVHLGGLYWHLVDLIWIYLFPLLYLIH